ncbi:rhamnan synthesis F family protein [Xanthomonas fragariae]|uniref:rhamnan synthesis F family protein n=1 Tax=Xanthomonas fragariae TaxID=48664 RepID=UPI000D560AE0|nr:rhamnan synthesis F family protein [Xanthomonas fragariae]MDM7553562.1 rhamnan synthesis F family protein [Xanthomonas fragariae]MDM7556713.1 rhamnan synthesis F family protein [Xanthomonas fragariae]MDM7574397.1 rhamnan synthesis F family protein [Xanthomonas fragariae]MDM7577529.1 rhamnan synthesis F family protein [Xanthomonas fragariae]MDM7587703.1 rhamnan synthesis F family protein [Xanthomonas fragariae]
MTSRFSKLLVVARRSIALHGGGVSGAMAVALRVFKVIRALGVRGFLQRVRLAGSRRSAAPHPSDEYVFVTPVPLSHLQLKVGVMVHVFYPDLIDELAQALKHMPISYDLLVSVMDEAAARRARDRFSRLPHLEQLDVRIVPNRGRDIAPLLVTFREQILALDIVGHLHTKKSMYTGSEQGDWRRYLISSLMGSSERIAWQLGMFQAEPRLGMLYPESYAGVPLWAHTWLSNFEVCRELAQRLGFDIHPSDYIDFPAGSMFWAKVDALRPLYALDLELQDFPEEHGQIDGTVHHAMERLFVAIARQHRYRIGVLPADGTLALSSEGERNWQAAFDTPLATQLTLSSLQARLVSLDIFDTLVVRPFLFPEGARAYLAHLIARDFGIENFVELRGLAESKARHQHGADVDLSAIYVTLATLPGSRALPINALQAMEIAVEAKLLRPRQGVIAAVAQLQRRGVRMVALSDMYLDSSTLRQILPAEVAALPAAWYVSCETGWRKDNDSAWKKLPEVETVPPSRWLHLGDNEHSDIQRPQMHKFLTPVHVLRPSVLFDVIPALRMLRPPSGSATRWQDQLWLGLLANRFADIADRKPEALAPLPTLSPACLGYIVLGPLVLDYLAWLTRLAKQRDVDTILFLSREGYLLEQAFQRLRQTSQALSGLHGKYLLASRRGTGTPSLHTLDDLALLLDSTYTGTLKDLIEARLGISAAEILERRLGLLTMRRDVYLPEMRGELMELMAPATDDLLELARQERQTYLRYWKEMTGDNSALVADIGYSGSIQANLTRLIGQPLGGAYFALTERATKITSESWAGARYFDGRTESDPTQSIILRHDLLLETLLTAPSPQFSHFTAGADAYQAVYTDQEVSATQWATIAQVHEGALAFIENFCDVAQDESFLLELDQVSIQIPLQCIGSGRWQAPWLAELQLEDRFTGRGAVSAG